MKQLVQGHTDLWRQGLNTCSLTPNPRHSLSQGNPCEVDFAEGLTNSNGFWGSKAGEWFPSFCPSLNSIQPWGHVHVSSLSPWNMHHWMTQTRWQCVKSWCWARGSSRDTTLTPGSWRSTHVMRYVAAVMSNSLRSCGQQPARLLCPWDPSGKNTGLGCISSSRGASQPRDRTQVSYVSCIAGGFFTTGATLDLNSVYRWPELRPYRGQAGSKCELVSR